MSVQFVRWHPTPSKGPVLLDAMLAAPLIGVSARWPTVLHAVDAREIVRTWKQRTVAAVCGRRHLRLLDSGGGVVPWPPAVRGLAPLVRCRECWERTGRRRPRCHRQEKP